MHCHGAMWSNGDGSRGTYRPTRRQLIRTGAIAGAGVTLASAFASTAQAEPADLVVDVDGGADYTNIQDAINALTPGGTIQVNPGSYPGEVLIDKALKIRGDPGGSSDVGPGPDAPVINGDHAEETAAFSLAHGVADVTIAGFDVRKWGSATADAAGVAGDANADITVADCAFYDVTRGIIGFDGDGWTVARNVIERASVQAVHLVNTTDATIAGNVAYGRAATRDPFDYTFQPIKLTADGRFGAGSRCADITIIGNEVVGRFQGELNRGDPAHGSGIYLLAINEAGGASEAVVENATIAGNLVETNHEFADRLHMGFRLAANPLDGGAVGIRDVIFADNVCDGARTAYQADTAWSTGVERITYRSNVAEDAEGGYSLGTNSGGTISTVRYEDNRTIDCTRGMILSARGTLEQVSVTGNRLEDNEHGLGLYVPDGGTMERLTVVENRFAENDLFGFGLAVNGRLADATVQGNEALGNSAGIRFTGGGELAGVEILENTLAENATGGQPPGAGLAFIDLSADTDIHAHHNKLRGNGVGVGAVRTDTSGIIVSFNDIVDNDIAGAVCFESSQPLIAQCNFWGHATGPTHDENRPGQGDTVSDDVKYAPWIPRSFEVVPEEACHVGQQHGN